MLPSVILRGSQVKTMLSLRLKVALLVLAHNLKFRNLIACQKTFRFVNPYLRLYVIRDRDRKLSTKIGNCVPPAHTRRLIPPF